VIDHTSVLKTIQLRWKTDPLTKRVDAASDLGDVLTLAAPRTDDPLAGVQPPSSDMSHPNASQPSVIEKIHAHKVSLLELRNDQGSYDRHEPPDLSTSAKVGDYIQSRMAAWTQHLERRQVRRDRRDAQGVRGRGKGSGPKKPGTRNPKPR